MVCGRVHAGPSSGGFRTLASAALSAGLWAGMVGAACTADVSAKLERITAFFDNEITTGKLPGAVVLIQQHGRPLYLKSFGVRDVRTGIAMTPDTIFALHSMTKPITSVAAMMLIDVGKLKLSDPLAKYIPSFADMKVGIETSDPHGRRFLKHVPADRPITIQDLLRHTSGITYSYIGGELIERVYMAAHILNGRYDNEEFAERIARLPLSRQPGTLWRYGHSTDIVGRVIEIISGQTLYQFEKQHIFDSLGMTSTKYVLDTPAERARMAEPLPDDMILRDAERERRAHPEWLSGGGGLVSTITDYARVAQMMLNGGELDGKRYLSTSAFKEMTSDHVGPGSGVGRDYYYFPGDGFGYGYGIAVRTDPGNAKPPPPGSISELKWDSGSGTYFGVDPKLDMINIMMEQTQNERSRITRVFVRLSAMSTRNHFNLAVDAVDDVEGSLKDLAFVLGDGAVFAFGQHDARECADRFLDDVAARRDHRPGGVGERFAAAIADQFQRDDGGAVGDDDVGQLAGLNADVGAHHRIGIAIVRYDVVGALLQQRDVAAGDVRQQRRTFATFKLAALVNRERNLVRRNLAGADPAFDAQAASRQHERLAVGFRLQRHGARRADQAERDMDHIIAGWQHDVRRRAALLADQLEGAVLVRLVGEHTPHQSVGDGRAVLGVARGEREHGLPRRGGRRGRCSRRRSRQRGRLGDTRLCEGRRQDRARSRA
jgi:CubicO group peptidase (beta-lactamase class C family)